MDYALIGYYLLGLVFASFYGTWLIAISLGFGLMLAYYGTKLLLPYSDLYQYVLSVVFGIFMMQFIYQMRGMFEMHFFSFIGSVLLVTYQKWKLQIPMFVVVVLHHACFGYLQNKGYANIYFTQLNNFDLRAFSVHILLSVIVFFICGLWSYQLKEYHEKQLIQRLQVAELQKNAQLSEQRKQHGEERITILESIGDAFFAVDKNWIVTYWNHLAVKTLRKPKHEIMYRNLWEVFADAVGSESYKKYHHAMENNEQVHFEDYYKPMDKWFEISAFPVKKGLSVYFKDITDRKRSEILLQESEKRYSDLFHLSPLPNWVFDMQTLKFVDVNQAAIKHYGYSRQEFLAMTIRDIRPATDIAALEQILLTPTTDAQFVQQGIFRHIKKNGEVIHVDIQSNNIDFKGRRARVIIATDVTEQMRYIKAIQEQNTTLREISWIQSHLMRAPVARILGLIPLIKNTDHDSAEKDQMLEYLYITAQELDDAIKTITEKTIVEDDKSKV